MKSLNFPQLSRFPKRASHLQTSILILVAFFASGERAWAQQDKPTAESLLKDSDRARGGLANGITWNVELESQEEEEASKPTENKAGEAGKSENKTAPKITKKPSFTYAVKARGDDAHVETLSPAGKKGEIMLFKNRTIWFFKTGLKKPVSLSARQKLSGEAANGDIASTNYARDYEGTIVGEEKVAGKDTYKLDLKARAKNVTYDKIRYWISKDKKLGIKAEFLTLQGDVLKSAVLEYGNKAQIEGKEYDFISKMVIQDPSFPNNLTTIKYGAPTAETHSESLFNINNLIR